MAFLYAEPFEIRQEALVRVRDAAELTGFDTGTGTLDADRAAELAERTAQEIAGRTRMRIDGAPATSDFDRAAFMRIGMRGLELLGPGESVDVDAGILGLIWSVPVDGLPQRAELEWDWFDESVPEVAAYAIDAAGPFLSPLTADDPVLVWKNYFKTSPYPPVEEIVVAGPDEPPVAVYALWIAALAGAGLAVFGLTRGRSGRRLAFAGTALAIAGTGAGFALQAQQARKLPELAPEQLASLTGDLLGNVYRAFDFRLEEQVYDRLALTLDGDILEQVYLEQRDALRIERAGGADARVDEIKVGSATAQGDAQPGTLRLRADWMVHGSVGHWGHLHRRSNAYEADLVLAPVEGAWRIVGFDVLSQERLQ